jgi:polysaccharide biosynthesis transport protein
MIPSSDAGYPMAGPMEEYAAPASPTGARRVVYFLRKFWWVPLLTMILALGGAVSYIRYWALPHFVSSASMWEQEKLRLPEATYTDNLPDYLGTQIELLRSRGLEKRVLTRLEGENKNAVPLGKNGRPLKVEISVKQSSKSTIFVIEAVTADPVYSQTYLDALLNEYIEYKKDVRRTASGDTLTHISEEVERLSRELNEEQAKLTAFERTNNLAILQEEGTVSGGYLAKLQTELSDLKLESQLLDASTVLPDQAKTNTLTDLSYSTRELGSSGAAAGSSEHFTPFQEIELLKIQREKLSQNLRPEHPKIVKLDAQIERDTKIIEIFQRQERELSAASRQKEREQLEAAKKNNKTRIANVVASIKEWETKVVEANVGIAEAERLKLNVSRTQTLFDRWAMISQNVNLSRNIDQETLQILEPASPPKRSYSVETSLLAGAGVGGLALGLLLVGIIGIRDDRFNSLAEVNAKFGDVIVGQLPDMPAMRGKARMPLLEVEDERDMYAESYRSLRSAIFFMPSEGERPKILLITSALPNEGKSTIAANLARTLALGGSRVLLVDADLRRGCLHDLLGMRLTPGLPDLLAHPHDLESILQRDSLPNFAFLSRGRCAGNPGDLFLASNLDELLLRFRKKFDHVIIDTSPVFAADDAASLAPKADGTLFVVRNRFSPAGAVKEALELLAQRRVRVLGLVFNRADTSARTYYYYKNADYYSPKKAAATSVDKGAGANGTG